MNTQLRPTPTTSATRTGLQPLTTPFKQPSDCGSDWSTRLTTLTRYAQETTSTLTILVSEPVSSCYPPGWRPRGEPHFSPATYWIREAMTVANPCYRRVWTDGEPVTSSVSSVKGMTTQTLMIHEAFMIAWDQSQTSTMTPQLPELTRTMEVPTWVPGQQGLEGARTTNGAAPGAGTTRTVEDISGESPSYGRYTSVLHVPEREPEESATPRHSPEGLSVPRQDHQDLPVSRQDVDELPPYRRDADLPPYTLDP
ncbi:hypothetical protein F66182_8017 [Fusarium sp. NRRL 66182]|nr:hypothetical protein F66182_8017 [Fusarium sp. NRRL 66182]